MRLLSLGRPLPPGMYNVTVHVSGFKSFTQTGIKVEVSQNPRVDARLEIGATTDTVNVAANVLSVDTETSQVGATIDSQRLVNLPLNGRNSFNSPPYCPGLVPQISPPR